MNEKQANAVSTSPDSPECTGAKYNAVTFEEYMEEKLSEQRQQLNEREAAFARLPVAIKRMTRGQAQLVGLYF